MNHWQNTRIIPSDPWIVKDVVSGGLGSAEARSVRFIVNRGDETLNIQLCSIYAKSDKSKEYLRSLLNKGDGSVVVNPVQTKWGVTIAEVFVQLKPDYERESHLNTEMVMAGVATIADYKNCQECRIFRNGRRN